MERFEGWFVKPIEVLKNSKDLPEKGMVDFFDCQWLYLRHLKDITVLKVRLSLNIAL